MKITQYTAYGLRFCRAVCILTAAVGSWPFWPSDRREAPMGHNCAMQLSQTNNVTSKRC